MQQTFVFCVAKSFVLQQIFSMYHVLTILWVACTHLWPLMLQHSSNPQTHNPLTDCFVFPALRVLVRYSFLPRISLSLLLSAALKCISRLPIYSCFSLFKSLHIPRDRDYNLVIFLYSMNVSWYVFPQYLYH